jgi:uncharacterized protein YndB with AHSA1/START domain
MGTSDVSLVAGRPHGQRRIGPRDRLRREPGGRIFERTRGGDEHDWGVVTVWDPPTRIVYQWHLRVDRADATEVEIRFVGRGETTTVEIEHRGWERLGSDGQARRDANGRGWATLLPHFVGACGLPPGS